MTDQEEYVLKQHYSQITVGKQQVNRSYDARGSQFDSQGVQSGSHQKANSVNQNDAKYPETIELIKPIEKAANTTEFLMLTLQKAFNYQPAQVQELLTNQNQYLMQACDLGIKGDYEQITLWFKTLIEFIQKMIQLFRVAYAHNSSLEVNLVLSSIRCGFFSQDEEVCSLSIEIMERISEDFFQKPIETGLQVIKNKRKSGASITEIKIPIFRQFQDWFVRSQKPQKAVVLRFQKGVQQLPQQLGDPSSMLRIVCTEVIENHSTLAPNVTRLILSVFRQPTIDISPINLQNLPDLLAEVMADDVYLCYQALTIVLPIVRDFDRGSLQKVLVESNLILRLLAIASERTPDPAMRLIATTLLFDLWYMEPIIVCNPRDGVSVKDTLNELIFSGLLHQDKVYRLTIYGTAFTQLNHLIDLKSQDAPQLLRTIITAFLQHLQGPNKKDRITEEFVLRNLSELFEQRQDIPIAVLLEPLIEILGERLRGERAQGGTQVRNGTITTEQLYFLIRVSQHPRITPQSAFLLLELLSTIYMGKSLVATTLLRSIADIVQRFYEKSKQIRSFVETIVIAKALSTILTYKKEELTTQSTPLYRPQLAITSQTGHQSEGKLASLPRNLKAENKKIAADLTKKITKYNMVILVECLYNINITPIQEIVTEQLQVLCDRYYTTFKTTSSAYEYLVRKLNLDLQLPSQDLALQTGQTPDVSSNYSSQGGLNQRAMSVELLGRKVKDMEQSRLENKNRQKQLQWSEAKEPRNQIALRAIEEMNELKQQRIKKQNAERIEELKKKEKMEKLIEGASADVAMRNLILEKEAAKRKDKVKEILAGKYSTAPSTAVDSSSEHYQLTNIFNPFHSSILGSMQKTDGRQKMDERELKIVLSLSRVAKEGITLVNFEFEEEERERDAMRLLVFRNQNLFKFLFCKFTQMGQLNKRKGSVETSNERLITFIETQKFLKEFGLESSLISQKELTTLIKMINDCMLLRHGQSALDYSGFVQLIIQTSILIYRRGRIKEVSPKQAMSMLSAELVQLMLKRFEEYAIKRGESALLYKVPQAMSSTSGVIDQNIATQITQLNQSIKPQLDKLDFQVSQSKVVKQVNSTAIPLSAQQVIGSARCNVLEILNEILSSSLGINFLESIITTKEGVEFSVLPAYSGLQTAQSDLRISQQSVKSNQTGQALNQNNKTVPSQKEIKPTEQVKEEEKIKSKTNKTAQQQQVPVATKGKDAKVKDTKGKVEQQNISPAVKLPPNYANYSLELLIPKLPNRSETKRNARQDLENEQILMGVNWTPQVKVACFELQQIWPCADLNDIREIAQLVEDMLMSTSTGKKYQTYQERENKKKLKTPNLPKFQEPVQLAPQISIIAKKKREESIKAKKDAEIELKQQRDIEFMKRGLMLKEQVKQFKEIKEEKLQRIKSDQINQNELEKQKQQLLSQRLKKFDQLREKERSEQAELNNLKQKQESLLQDIKKDLTVVRMKLARVTNQVFQECRDRFCQDHGEFEDQNQQVQASDVMDLYKSNQAQAAFLQAQPEFKKHFLQVLEQQNVTSRALGAPQHRGLNLDGVINFCIRAELLPQLVQVDDVIYACKLELRDRDHLNLRGLGDKQKLLLHPRMQVSYPTTLQLINFENRGGQFDYDEFCLVLTRLFVLTSQRKTVDSFQKMEIDVNENELYQDALSLNVHSQVTTDIEKILQCQNQTLALNNLLQELSILKNQSDQFANQRQQAPIKPMKLDIDQISYPEFQRICQFISQRLQEYKLIKLPIIPVSDTPLRSKDIQHRRFSSMTPLKTPMIDQQVFQTSKKQQLITNVQQTSTEPRKVPLKSQGLKSSQAVNNKEQPSRLGNHDLPKVFGEVSDRDDLARANSGLQVVDDYYQQKPVQSSNMEDQRNFEEKKQTFDSYRDVLENSEDMFQDYNNMTLTSPRNPYNKQRSPRAAQAQNDYTMDIQ